MVKTLERECTDLYGLFCLLALVSFTLISTCLGAAAGDPLPQNDNDQDLEQNADSDEEDPDRPIRGHYVRIV